ncbi:Oidioi.mRNA.OKI2018_I69.PAR.g9214.t1.cds [Oikopleura dioica]|uniref:Oidioi.mRNA.OKI2018_I69.PAR.g9214.t1.cds n=1 Tax=Oikopleura dioica TaxID=34765 RepID=A0ABN7RJK2_OIKDI|nr:Oidioi.mRNA.OKI2018_I69.PAR.g9214.t1.cds [Oikopleura dioica]
MKLFSFFAISALAQENEWDDDYLEFDAAEFYGNKLNIARNPAAREIANVPVCCDTLKNILPPLETSLFPSTKNSPAGSFTKKDDKDMIRGYSSDEAPKVSCPEQSGFMIWDGENFTEPDLQEPWSPYIVPSNFLECVPEEFSAHDLSDALVSKFCGFTDDSRLCGEAKRAVHMTFAEWDDSTDSFLKPDTLMRVKYVENLDQWHALLKTVIIRRTWSSAPDVQDALNHFIRDLVNRTRAEYSSQPWAAEDPRFLWLNAQN